MKNKIYIKLVNICPRSALDIDRIKHYLDLNNYTLVSRPEKADTILIFGCSFNNTIQEEALKEVNKLKKYTSDVFVLEGIANTLREELIKEGFDPKKIIGRGEYNKLDEFFASSYKLDQVRSINISPMTRKGYYIVQVCWGCDSNCSYCGDKIIVGNIRSKSLDECIKEIKKGISLGHKKIHLLGDDVGAYGIDIGLSFIDLLNEINKLKGNFTITIEEINMKYLVKNLEEFDEILSHRKIKMLFMIGIQSWNNRILKLMNRGYTKEDVQKLIDVLKKRNIKSGFHTIVGFPTETREEFKETIDFIKRNDLSHGIIFKYQDKKYIPSHQIYPKISEEEINSRLDLAIDLLKDKYKSGFGFASEKSSKATKNIRRDSDRVNVILKSEITMRAKLYSFVRQIKELVYRK